MAVYISGASQIKGSSTLAAFKSDSYIAYELRSNSSEVITSRRYTEFEALQAHLYRSYPRSVIPPIPQKENLADYFTKLFTGKSESVNQRIIQQRIFALQVFLEFIESHPALSKDLAYRNFVSNHQNWLDVQELTMNPPATSHLDNPLSKKILTLKNSLEAFEKSEAKLLRGFKETAEGYSELGAALNGFSLEQKSLSTELDAVGQKFDEIGNLEHELVLTQTHLVETIQLSQQFCESIQRAIDNNVDADEEMLKTMNEEASIAVQQIRSMLDKATSNSIRSQSMYYSKANQSCA